MSSSVIVHENSVVVAVVGRELPPREIAVGR